ncbi:MAG: DUF3820 family protein [Dechloromonas sp.]|nr:DUF3820 family protein [Dechloromonas sp.]MBT9521696.1 DUF3820 family protein [Dechloromonas sp.]
MKCRLSGNYLNWWAYECFPPGGIGRLLVLILEVNYTGLSDLLKPLRRK